MLQQFSWGHFLIAMVVLNLLWYVFVLLVCYRSELLGFLAGGRGANGITGMGKDVEFRGGRGVKNLTDEKIAREVDAALMGASRLPDGVELKSSAQVAFAGGGEDDRYDQFGLVADVVQELKNLFSDLEKRAGDKRDFFSLFDRVKQEYGPLGGHPSVAALTGFILERAPFHLTADEIDNLWY